MSGGIFISYRRDDSQGWAGRIYDHLLTTFDREDVFIDVDNIAPGRDFVDELTERVASCDALVAIIGKRWSGAVDRQGRRRLDNPFDFVRVEVEAALDRKVLVIPVLVDDAQMPDVEELPTTLQRLARRNAVEITHARFRSDTERLLKVLKGEFETRQSAREKAAEAARDAEEARAAEEERRAEAARKAEAARLVEEARKAEAARLAEEARQAEAARLAQEAALAELARLAEETHTLEAARAAEDAHETDAARAAGEARRAEIARAADKVGDAETARKAKEARGTGAAGTVAEHDRVGLASSVARAWRAGAKAGAERDDPQAVAARDQGVDASGQGREARPRRYAIAVAVLGLAVLAFGTSIYLRRAATESPVPVEAPAAAPQAPEPSPQEARPASATPEAESMPVAYRAALLVEANDQPSKVATFPGTVIWKSGTLSDDSDRGVEADIDVPGDKARIVFMLEKNTDPSLPATHTMKVRFTIAKDSYSGDVKQISVPQMRREANLDGEPLAGVTVPVTANSFLVGLSPGKAEKANLQLIDELPWIDIPILLTSGKIAKVTFEKGAVGQRYIHEALAAWDKH